MPYALQRIRDGMYVARPGFASYVRGIENARAFNTLDEAKRDQCSNERIVRFGYVETVREVAP